MQNNTNSLNGKVALITGAARRIGTVLAQTLHAEGMNLALHYRNSKQAAHVLQEKLNAVRANSVVLLQADLLDCAKVTHMVQDAISAWGKLDVLINNASSFYPTPIGSVTEAQWDELMGSNLRAPFFAAQAATRALGMSGGCIVNIVDIHAERPLKTYPVYSTAKAGLVMLTKALACELAPLVRVNAVAPGAILWPETIDQVTQQRIISRSLLKRQGNPGDIARAVLYLIRDADYVTGQVITVDGGRSINA